MECVKRKTVYEGVQIWNQRHNVYEENPEENREKVLLKMGGMINATDMERNGLRTRWTAIYSTLGEEWRPARTKLITELTIVPSMHSIDFLNSME